MASGFVKPDQQQNSAPQASAQGSPPPPMVVQTPYVPTPQEEEYLTLCGEAIAAGCDFAKSAEAAQNPEAYLKFAQGVKSLTDAYTAIKHGGNVSRHQGA